ncbi:hypothetical protein MKY30_16205 [Oceanobacillus sp. FSL W8-0428]|uniref:hypothetical protein n=1 Tax=Oceanobacillus sp. FSL W8-0428 TaxID=2921715 RepID=UPI0030F5263F
MIPLITNDGEFVEVLESNNLINDKLVILEKLQEEIQFISNSVYTEIGIFYYARNERDENKTFHFLFGIDPSIQNHVKSNSRNAIVALEFLDIVAVF